MGHRPARRLFGAARAATPAERAAQARALIGKIARQVVKDYVLYPALSRSRWRRTLAADAAANLLRNLWAYMVIFCAHFPDGAEKFTAAELEHETRAEWYFAADAGRSEFQSWPAAGVFERQPVLPQSHSTSHGWPSE